MDNNGVLLFGGTFDPIHHGHLIVVRAAAEQLAVAKVVLVPSAAPPHKENEAISAAEDRLTMVRLTVEGDDLFEVSDCELRREGPSYTLETVRSFRETLGAEACLYWLIGYDTIQDLPQWYRVGELMEECTLVTALRPGHEKDDLSGLRTVLSEEQVMRLGEYVLETPLVEVSATDIRQRVKLGQSIRYLVPAAVEEYISKEGLYRS